MFHLGAEIRVPGHQTGRRLSVAAADMIKTKENRNGARHICGPHSPSLIPAIEDRGCPLRRSNWIRRALSRFVGIT